MMSAAFATILTITPAPGDPLVRMGDVPASITAIEEVLNADGFYLPQDSWEANHMIQPPAQFNHPFRGTIHVTLVSEWDMDLYCGQHRVWGCIIEDKTTADHIEMILPVIDAENIGITKAALQGTFIHERAHGEGWPDDHGRPDQEAKADGRQ